MKSLWRIRRMPAAGALVALIVSLGAVVCAAPAPHAGAAPVDPGVEAPDVTIVVDGRALTLGSVFPRIAGGRILVPFRDTFRALGVDEDNITWIDAEKRIIVKKGWLTLDFRVGDTKASLNSAVFPVMDVPPVIVNDRTLVPLRFVSETLGAHVEWDAATRTATIRTTSESDMETALDHPHGTISDASGDFVGGVAGSPPGGTYSYPPADISRISVATDARNLFVKIQFNGVIPEAPATVEGGNRITGLKVRVAVDTDASGDTGVKTDKGAEALLAYDVDLESPKETASYYGAPSASGYGRHAIGRIQAGGVGYGYVTLAYYLDDLGIKRGNPIELYAWSSASTPEWPAFTFDEAPNREQKEKARVNIPLSN